MIGKINYSIIISIPTLISGSVVYIIPNVLVLYENIKLKFFQNNLENPNA